MNRILFGLITIYVLTLTAKADTPGIAGSLDISIITQAKEVYFNYMLGILNGVALPDLEIPDGYIKDNSFYVKQNAQDVIFYNNPDTTSIKLQVTQLTTWFRSNSFQYKLWFIPVTGYLDASLSKVQIQADIQLTNQTLNGRYLPAISVLSASTSIDADQISFDLGGGLLASIADIILPLFQGIIKTKIEEAITSAIKTTFPSKVNSYVTANEGYLNINQLGKYCNVTIDYALEEAFNMTSEYISAAFNGTIFDFGNYTIPPQTQIDMPSHNSSLDSKFQLFFSNYFAQSASDTFFKVASIEFSVPYTAIPDEIPIKTTTSTLDAIIPAMAQHYGKNVPVDLYFKVKSVHDMDSFKNVSLIRAKVDVDIMTMVHYDNGTLVDAGVIEAIESDAYFSVKNDGLRLTAYIEKVVVEQLWVNTTLFGRYESSTFLANLGFSLGLPFANKFLASKYYFDLPSSILGIFQLSDLNITYFDHYLQFGMTPTFLPFNSTTLSQSFFEEPFPEARSKMTFLQTPE